MLLLSTHTEQDTSQITKFSLRKEQPKAEMLWALKSIMSHFSYNSAHDIDDVFRAMFLDSDIAQNLNCEPTKFPI